MCGADASCDDVGATGTLDGGGLSVPSWRMMNKVDGGVLLHGIDTRNLEDGG